MSDMYTDIERSLQQTLLAAMTPVSGLTISLFNNQVTKADYKNSHGAISIMKVSDVFQPANSGGTKAEIKTPVVDVNNNRLSFTVQEWPDPFDLVYSLTVSAETKKDPANPGGVIVSGLEIVRYCDSLIRSALRPRQPLKLWDSTLNGGTGGWSDNYVNYVYAGYINRDSPQEEIYNRVTNLRIEAFNYSVAPTNEGIIKEITTTLNDVPTTQS